MDEALRLMLELAAKVAGIPGVDAEIQHPTGKYLSYEIVEQVTLCRGLVAPLQMNIGSMEVLKSLVCRAIDELDVAVDHERTEDESATIYDAMGAAHRAYSALLKLGQVRQVRKCNLHDDCDEADKSVKEHRGCNAFHCSDPKCAARECSRQRFADHG